MIIVRIFKIIARILEILIILCLIFYPVLVLKENPFTYYWDMFTELWIVIREPGLLSKIFSVFN